MVHAAERTYDPRALEQRIVAHWAKTDAYRQTKAHRAHGEPYYFLDGPPYATGHIHIGTARNKLLKDVFVRHMRAKGYNVRDQPGYDMHGLPIEVKVEKELGIKMKKEIEEHGIDRFVNACRTFAVEHLEMMNKEFEELAVWLDWSKPYMTITNDYIEGAWWAIEKAHERGLLFDAQRVLTWCWRCETALANAEIEFEEREDPSAYVKFPLAEPPADRPGLTSVQPGDFLVVWTTTPWTLPANVAIAANPLLYYARVRATRGGQTEFLIVLKEQVETVVRIGRYDSHEIVGSPLTGAYLEGWKYAHPFAAEVPHHAHPEGREHTVIQGLHVAADRTGLVHTATGHGVEDFEAGKKYGIPIFSPVGEDGKYTSEAGALEGLAVKTKEGTSPADAKVLDLLKHKGLLVGHRNEKHSYGHCWRCKNPIVFRATKQWFIAVPKILDKMKAEVKRVEWTPEWAGSARQMDWVENARDWCISRQRYWGIPLPIWTCTAPDCHEKLVIGSRRELHHVSDAKSDLDLHRPWIDKVRVACPRRGCGGVMKRVPDVLDVWFDSAVAAWASLGYPAHKKDFETLYPAKWIVEGLDQTRGWFYSQLAAGVAAMDRVPYERVVMHGWVLMDGEKMSKSLGNAARPTDIISKFGCDAFRLGLIGGAAPWEDVNFSPESLQAAQRSLNILWNVHVFATQYMHADGYRFSHEDLHRTTMAEDKWLLSRLQSVVADSTHHFEASEFHKAAREVERFVLDDLSRWYVRLVRERVWDERPSADKTAAYATLHEALSVTARLLAPFTPHLAEAIHQDLTEGKGKPTVHMEDWPVADATLTDFDLEKDMATVRAAVDAAAYARQKANMKLRWPVAKLTFASDDPDVRSALTRFKDLILEQANAKDIELVTGEWERLDLAVTPNKTFFGKTFRQHGPKVLATFAEMNQHDLRRLRRTVAAKQSVPVRGDLVDAHPELASAMIPHDALAFETRLPADTSGADFTGGSVYVETKVPPELLAEGAARDLTRRVQEMRKQLGLAMNATIHTQVEAPAEFRALVAPQLQSVREATRSATLAFVAKPQGDLVKEWDLEGTALTIGVATRERAAKAPAAPKPRSPAAPRPKAVAAKKPAAKKPAPKRSPAKKAPATKPSPKKAAPKKPAAKKKAPAKKTKKK